MRLLAQFFSAGPPPRAVLAAALAALSLSLSAGAQERFRRTPPLPDAQRLELKLPPIETFPLPNGLTVVTARRPGTPVITLQLVVRSGEADSPPGRPGLASVTARMIGKGTKIFSADYLENVLESLGADFSVTVFMDYTVLTINVLDEFLDRAIRILRIMALEATFSERELAAVRRTSYWQLVESKKDPEVLVRRQLLSTLFADHPYRIATYSEELIKFITARDVAGFYNTFYRPGNAAVLISGDIDGAAVAQRVDNYFGAWTGVAPERESPAPPRQNERKRICYVEAPGSAAAMIFAGNVIMGSSSRDLFPFLVLKQILGGTTRSRLFMNLRETKDYAMYAFAEMEVFGSCGLYWARALVKPEFIVPAVSELLGEIGALASGPAVPTEIEEAKSYLVGSLPLQFESSAGFAEWMARFVARGLDPSQWDKGPEELRRVDAERVRETARKYLSAEPVVVIVGSPEWLGRYLGGLDAVEVYDTFGQLKRVQSRGEGQ